MKTSGTKVGPGDPVVEELRRQAKRMRKLGDDWSALARERSGSPAVGYAYAGSAWTNAAAMLERRATRLERAARKGAR